MDEPLKLEWVTLQNNHEAYERSALLIKLLAVVLLALGYLTGFDALMLGALLSVLWLQEAMLKTWQARLADRLQMIEQALQPDGQRRCNAFQLHSQWLAQRPGTMGLMTEYARSALRPTVAFPYAVLLVLTFISRV
jgi:hypothetical protein